jgi:hypothetical protein
MRAELLERLPAYYREQPGLIPDLLAAIADTVETWSAVLAPGGEAPRSRAEAVDVLRGLSIAEAGARRRRSPLAARELGDWLEIATGRRPELWPGLRLEPEGSGARRLLRVSAAAAERRLALVWRGKPPEPSGGGRWRDVQADLSDRLPVGLELQFASLPAPEHAGPPLGPWPPRVEGTLLEGGLLEP